MTDSSDFIGIALICTTCVTRNKNGKSIANQGRKHYSSSICSSKYSKTEARYLALVVLEDEHHIEIPEMKLDSLKVDTLHLGQRQDECRLKEDG